MNNSIDTNKQVEAAIELATFRMTQRLAWCQWYEFWMANNVANKYLVSFLKLENVQFSLKGKINWDRN